MHSSLDRSASSAGWGFIVLALSWTWAFGVAAVAFDASAGHPLHLLALVGPVIAWLCVIAVAGSRASWGPFLRRLVDGRAVRPAWWLAIFAVGVGPALVAAASGAVDPQGTALEPSVTVAGALGALGFAVAAGLGEEPGWRGLVLDAMLTRRPSALLALGVGVLWTSWHLPLYFIEGTYQAGLDVDSMQFWTALAGPVPLSLLLVWLVAGTHGAIVAAVVAHALGNLAGEVLATGAIAAVLELLVLSAAAVAVVLTGEWERRLRLRWNDAPSSHSSSFGVCEGSTG